MRLLEDHEHVRPEVGEPFTAKHAYRHKLDYDCWSKHIEDRAGLHEIHAGYGEADGTGKGLDCGRSIGAVKGWENVFFAATIEK